MLKKAGIVVAAAAAGLLAVSPLAFAGDKGGHDGHDGGHHDTASAVISDDDNVNNVDQDRNQVGLVNVNDNEVNVPIQVCNNNVSVLGVSEVVLGLLGSGSSDDSCTQSNQSGDTLLQNISD